MEAVILYTTWPDADTARACAGAAVEAGLAACANILAPMTSVYRWEGVLEEAAEVPALFKTTGSSTVYRLNAKLTGRKPDGAGYGDWTGAGV